MQEVLCDTDNYHKPHVLPRSKLVNGKCESQLQIEALFGMMSSQHKRGFTLLSVQYKDKKTFDIGARAQTDAGLCSTLVPDLLFNPNYIGKNRFYLLKDLKSGTIGGKANGVRILIDTEAYDQGVETSLAVGATLQVYVHIHIYYIWLKWAS